jgi:hypothetical protein
MTLPPHLIFLATDFHRVIQGNIFSKIFQVFF